MRREGSPWQGLGTVFVKELADHVTSIRMLVLEILIAIIAVVALAGAIGQIREMTAEDPFVLLKLFTVTKWQPMSLKVILGFLLPLPAICLACDAVNAEHNRRTLSRILSQPIYRDALLAGKFLAAFAAVAVSLLCLWLLVVGLGIIFLGVPPNGEEVVRSLVFMFIAAAYAGIWLALAMLLSTAFRSVATTLLVALGLWLFLTLLWPWMASAIASGIAPPDPRFELLCQQLGVDQVCTPDTFAWTQALSRISPYYLYDGAATSVLVPTTQGIGLDIIAQVNQLRGGGVPAPLSLSSSLAIASPWAVALIASVIVLFVATYVLFQRQEVRA
jgi:ABC-2 type transport system permease protein